jgi:hypothetical protein
MGHSENRVIPTTHTQNERLEGHLLSVGNVDFRFSQPWLWRLKSLGYKSRVVRWKSSDFLACSVLVSYLVSSATLKMEVKRSFEMSSPRRQNLSMQRVLRKAD